MESHGNSDPCPGPHLFPKDWLPSSLPRPWQLSPQERTHESFGGERDQRRCGVSRSPSPDSPTHPLALGWVVNGFDPRISPALPPQFTEEKFGQAEKTELDAHFENLLARADSTKNWTERILRQTEVLLQPSPSEWVRGRGRWAPQAQDHRSGLGGGRPGWRERWNS